MSEQSSHKKELQSVSIEWKAVVRNMPTGKIQVESRVLEQGQQSTKTDDSLVSLDEQSPSVAQWALLLRSFPNNYKPQLGSPTVLVDAYWW